MPKRGTLRAQRVNERKLDRLHPVILGEGRSKTRKTTREPLRSFYGAQTKRTGAIPRLPVTNSYRSGRFQAALPSFLPEFRKFCAECDYRMLTAFLTFGLEHAHQAFFLSKTPWKWGKQGPINQFEAAEEIKDGFLESMSSLVSLGMVKSRVFNGVRQFKITSRGKAVLQEAGMF